MENDLERYIPLTETMFLVLLTMLEENYGYKVSKEVEEITKGRVVLGPGTLYGAINNLCKKGWIELINKDKENGKKVYKVTETGKELVLLEINRMEALVSAANFKFEKEGQHE